MLCQFTFQNFKSYRDEITLDMQAATIDDQEDNIIHAEDGKRFLPIAAIYGPNGGGKSNVLEAFSFLVSKIMVPISVVKSGNANEKMPSIHSKPFKFDKDSINEPSKFEVFFRTKKFEYKYNISIFDNKIKNESLIRRSIGGKKPTLIFERSDEIKAGTVLKGVKNADISPYMPYLSFLSISYDISAINDVVSWFKNCEIHNFGNPIRDIVEFHLNDAKKYKKQVVEMLNEMDIDIVDFWDKKDNEGNIMVYTKHHALDGNNSELLLGEESDGTIKLFGSIPFIISSLKNGSPMIVDELDAKLHPKLLRYIIEIFKNMDINKNQAQLIFTSHDLSTMNNRVFRRDEIWFAAKNDENASELYSLVEFRKENGEIPRKDETFDKQYLEGRYGADPYLKHMLNWGEVL